MDLKNYFNYVQEVLGAKSFILPVEPSDETIKTSYQFAVPSLSFEAKEILTNIIKALNAEKYHILELKTETLKSASDAGAAPNESVSLSPVENNSVLIIFGKATAHFLMPHTQIDIGETLVVEGSKTLLTYAIEDMIMQPELKRVAWQHLKAFVSVEKALTK